jgi:hypothetical protein
MNKRGQKGLCLQIAAIYRIHVQDILESSYSNRLAGMKITIASHEVKAPVTTQDEPLPDQATQRLQHP